MPGVRSLEGIAALAVVMSLVQGFSGIAKCSCGGGYSALWQSRLRAVLDLALLIPGFGRRGC